MARNLFDTVESSIHETWTCADPHWQTSLVVKLMTITPDLAASWLASNMQNRRVRSHNLTRIERALKEARWQHANGETIIFDVHAVLIDGQHRLQAIVNTQIPMTTLVVFGVEPEKRASVDTGSARILSDYLHMLGYSNTSVLAAALTLHARWSTGTLLSRGPSIFSSYQSGVDYLDTHQDMVESVKHMYRIPRGLMVPSQLACLDYIFYEKDPRMHDRWLTTMITGEAHPDAGIFLALRERLLRDQVGRVARTEFEHFVYNLKAWNAARTHRYLKTFRWREDEPLPELL